MTLVPGSVARRAFLAGSIAAPLIRAAAAKPNVLIFMTDQESAMTPGPLRRPGRDSLEKRGVRFTQAFCNSPQCSPARSSLLTGLQPHKAGVLTNVDASSLGKPLAPSLPTVGSVFRDGGYRTGYFGKWHLGDERGPLTRFGFDTYEGGKDDAVAKAAAEWIRNQTQPWLAWVSVLNPHHIYEIVHNLKSVAIRDGVRAPATRSADLAAKPKAQRKYLYEDQGKPTVAYTPDDWVRYRSYYCDLIEKADRCLTTVLDSVKEPQQTIVAYTSDHGDALGEHGLPFKGPFLYEPLIRIPMVIAGPGVRGGGVSNNLATSADLAPTVASLAGLTWPGPLDGVDLFRAQDRDAVLLEYYGKQQWVEPIRAIRTRQWKLCKYDSGERELYDLEHDPNEVRNLAGSAGARRDEELLMARLEKWGRDEHR